MDYVINLFIVSSSLSLMVVKVAERKKIRISEVGYQVTGHWWYGRWAVANCDAVLARFPVA